jgi:hypothetical protein
VNLTGGTDTQKIYFRFASQHAGGNETNAARQSLVEGSGWMKRVWKNGAKMFEVNGMVWGIVTIIFGVLIIAFPYLLHYVVGIYLIIVGLWAVMPRLKIGR